MRKKVARCIFFLSILMFIFIFAGGLATADDEDNSSTISNSTDVPCPAGCNCTANVTTCPANNTIPTPGNHSRSCPAGCNCTGDVATCPARHCANEGQRFSKVYKEYPKECCAGLKEWNSGMDTRVVEDEKCVKTGRLAGSPVGTCLKCGDGICRGAENLCNCPEDCKPEKKVKLNENFTMKTNQTVIIDYSNIRLRFFGWGEETACAKISCKEGASCTNSTSICKTSKGYRIDISRPSYGTNEDKKNPSTLTSRPVPPSAPTAGGGASPPTPTVTGNPVAGANSVPPTPRRDDSSDDATTAPIAPSITSVGMFIFMQIGESIDFGGITLSLLAYNEIEDEAVFIASKTKCPAFKEPEKDWCKDGKIISGGADNRGCKLQPICAHSTSAGNSAAQFFKGASWQCYDGSEEKEKEDKCRPAAVWQAIAMKSCKEKCSEKSGKCGVNSFSLLGACSSTASENGSVMAAYPTLEISNETIGSLACVDGCSLDGKCYPISYRKSGKYCSDSGSFEEQKKSESSCENNFECSSNVCVSGSCVDQGILKKILNWFKNLF